MRRFVAVREVSLLEDREMKSVDAGQRTGREGHKQGQSRGDETPRGSSRRAWLAFGGVAIVLAVAGWATHRMWLPRVQVLLASVNRGTDGGEVAGESVDLHAGAAGSADNMSLAVSAQGRKNIGLTLQTVTLGDFERTITIPATLVERSSVQRPRDYNRVRPEGGHDTLTGRSMKKTVPTPVR